MVEIYQTDEEQIAAIKRWWAKDGLQTVALIIAVFVAYFSWQAWQKHSQEVTYMASDVYEQLLKVDATASTATTLEDQAKVLTLIETLKTDHKGIYAEFASMYGAKYAVNRGDYDAAEAELSWVIAQTADDNLADSAQLRLARVLFAAGKHEEALAAIIIDEVEAWHAAKYELQGDIYADQAKFERAQSAYEAATTLVQGTMSERGLSLKLNSVVAKNVKTDSADE